MEEALSSHRSFNVIHFETSFKVDLFVQGPSEFEQRLLERGKRLRLSDTGRRDVAVVSPEDIILLKLRWFRETGGTSQRQWDDVLGVLAVQGESLDFEYLTASAQELGPGGAFGPSKGRGGYVGLCMTLKDRHESLQKILKDLGQVVVAYSGGVDSTFLLKAAVDTLGAENVLACTSVGPAEPGNML